MRRLKSLSHLTAVSGANCAVVISLIMMIGAALRWKRGVRIAAALVALGGFVILVTPGPSVLRAAIMATILVLSLGAGRPGRGVPALAFAVIVLLTLDPWMSRNYGFVLSVLATAGLLVLARPLAARLARFMPTPLSLAISIPLAAQIACQPLLILLSPTVPVYGVVANLLAEPAAPVATVLGLVSCVLMPFAPGIGFACAQIAWVPSAWIAAVARVCSSLPGSQLPWPHAVSGVILMSAILLAILIVVLRDERVTTRMARHVRVGSVVILLIFAGVYSGSIFGRPIAQQLTMPKNWEIGACDIGQGDAIMIHDGSAYGLVDVGPEAALLRECLRSVGVDRLDLLVLTHYDFDHVGGIDAVVGKVGIALVGAPENSKDQRVVDKLEAGGADVRIAVKGDNGTFGRTSWKVIWPKSVGDGRTSNESSVTVRFDGHGFHSIFLGDLDERAQTAIVRAGGIVPVDVVKVAHHGSADQSSKLYEALHARVGLISDGWGNSYGHPTQRILDILSGVGTTMYRTDLQGMILVSHDSKGSLSVWTERSSTREQLMTPAGGKETVSSSR